MPLAAREDADRCRRSNGSAREGRPRTSFGGRSELLLLPGDSQQRDELFDRGRTADRKSTRLNSSHRTISYAVFCLKKKKKKKKKQRTKKKNSKIKLITLCTT